MYDFVCVLSPGVDHNRDLLPSGVVSGRAGRGPPREWCPASSVSAYQHRCGNGGKWHM